MDLVTSPILLTCLSIILFILSYQILSKRLNKNSPKKKYPPIAGIVFHQLVHFKRLHHYMTDLASKHKTYRILNLFRNEIYTSDPLNVEYILKSNFDNYVKGSYNYEILKDLLGDGIFTVDGEKWRQQRKISSYEFSTRVLRDFSSVIFRENASKVAVILSEVAKTGQTIDFQDISMKATLDSIFQVALGVELDTMCGSSEEGKSFSNAFDDASSIIVWRYVDVFWKIKKFLNIGTEADIKRKTKIVNTFVFKLIDKKIEQINNAEEKSPIKREDILSRFLHANEHDPIYLRDVILNIIIAGKDTTATTLSWLIYLLCKHPHIQSKIVKEVREVTKTDVVTNYTEFADSISEEVLENLHYLHATITETLRLYPPLPVDPKICLSDDTLPDGFSVKKGDMICYQPFAMGRMKFLWGEDANEFKPERWLNQDGVFQPQSPFKFAAFQAGPRLCLGKEFAYRQLKIFAAVLLSCFVFEMGDENRIVRYKTMINLHIDGGLEVRVFDRNAN